MVARAEVDFQALSERIEREQRAATRRAVWLTLVPLSVGLLIVGYSVVQANAANAARVEVRQARETVSAQRRALTTIRDSLSGLQGDLKNARDALEAGRQGINLFHAGRYDDAVRNYDAALRNDPSNPYILNLKGYSLFKGGRLSEAEATIRRAVSADTTYAWGYFDLARVYCADGKMSDALAAAQKALSLRPDLISYMRGSDGEFMRLCRPILSRIKPADLQPTQ